MTRPIRGTSPLVGTIVLVGLTVVLAAAIGALAFDAMPSVSPGRPIVVSAAAEAGADRIVLVHRAGPPVDVRDLAILIAVDGVPLDHQPPVPFFAATGFRSGPTGPFNPAADPVWEPGETASLRLAATNAPTLTPGATLTVRIASADRVLARIEVSVR